MNSPAHILKSKIFGTRRSIRYTHSPARIRTAVHASKVHDDWPLHHGTVIRRISAMFKKFTKRIT